MKRIYDLETYKVLWLYCDIDPETNEKHSFEISFRRNDLYKFIKYITETPITWHISFNGVNFDANIIQFILENYEKWFDLTNLEIVKLIYDFAQQVINDTRYDIKPPYKETDFHLLQVDLFQVHHYSNRARSCGLKWLEFSMDMPVIDELPIHHNLEVLTEEEIERVISYCWNDIEATKTFYFYSIGETDNKTYQGKNKLQLREDVRNEFGFPIQCINWNDVKIGAELNKSNYCKIKRISPRNVWDFKKKSKSKTNFTFGDCYPKYWKFDTPKFQEFFEKIAKTKVSFGSTKQEFTFEHNGTTYTIGRGGCHTTESGRKILPKDNEILQDADISSMYPNAIRKRGIYPHHLGKEWNQAYCLNIPKRLEAKKLYKETKEKRYDNFQETYKLSLNGCFGRLIDTYDWQYDPYAGMCVTIGSQIDILMLMEDLESEGIHIISLNTDSILCLFDRSKLDDYYRICKEWEKQVGNDTLGNLEYAEYEFIVQTSVNDYIALKKGDEPLKDRIKQKGDFAVEFELHKNKSKRIVPLALEQYFVNNIPVEETIKNHTNIYDFCIAKKSSQDYYYKGVNRSTGETNIYNKLIRYYVSQKGEKLYKCKHENSLKTGPKLSECESTSQYQVMFNVAFFPEKFEDYKIDYNYYISECKKLIYQVQPELKRIEKDQKTGQLSMF